MRKLLLSFLFFSLLSTVYGLLSTVHAAGEFETSYNVQYQIDDTGKAIVNQKITLKNKTTNFYADKFELKIGSTKVENVKAADTAGPLQTEVKFENNLTTIAVKFNQKVIGIEKTLPWTLSYESNELASRSGQIWEVSIPRLAKSDDIGTYDATVSVPTTFGPVAFAVPNPITSAKTGATQQYSFNKDQLELSGIAMSFGTKQVFSFSLNYYLENRNLTAQTQEIALPPDSNYQKIVLQKLEPAPLDVIVDSDNNFKALYKLEPKTDLNIKAEGYVEVFSQPFRNIYEKLTPAQKQKYTEAQRYWETDNNFIKTKAEELKTPEAIYKFVSTYLSYNEDRLKQAKLERKGAAAAALSPKDAVCTEFTDLFIALARSAGIPAREVEGYAYTQNERLRPLSLTLQNGDILHAWPEYWDDKLGWVQVDPTWGSTSGGLDYFNKLDFNHITFVERGISSVSPFPAGSYKKPGQGNTKDVNINFAVELPNITATPSLNLIFPKPILAGIPTKVTAEVKNIGTSSIISEDLILRTQALKKTGGFESPSGGTNEHESIQKIYILPPFANRSYQFTLQGTNFWQKIGDTLVLSYFNSQISAPVEVIPIYSLVFLQSFLIVLVIAIFLILAGLFLYKKFGNKHPKFPPHKIPKLFQ
ncbi:transglutaminase domain-containing protein [Candidatus Curtissbacteria bacterium]|nr:transglutaminase domain-containing protein [Candidatus Curtissbacteria bacterium]